MRLTGFVLSFFGVWPQTTGTVKAEATNYFFGVWWFVSGNVNLLARCARVYVPRFFCVFAGLRSENMITFVWVNELLTEIFSEPCSEERGRLRLFGMYSMGTEGEAGECEGVGGWWRCWGGGGGCWAGDHCLVKLKEERWHAVSLSWRSPLNALAPPDISYSQRGDRSACGMPRDSAF